MIELPVIPGLSAEDVATLLNVKTLAQYKQYVADMLAHKCPFCEPLDTNLNRVISEHGGWRMWHNPFPAPNSRVHLVIAPVRHITHPHDLATDDWHHMTRLISRAVSQEDWLDLELPGGGVLMRWGNPRWNAGSIRHIHTNIIVPNGEGEVRLPLAKNPKDVEKKSKTLHVFEKMRRGATVDDLAYAEYQLVKDLL